MKDKMESTMIASKVGVDDLEEHLRKKRLRRFRHTVRRAEEVEIKKVLDTKIAKKKAGQ